ncbi:hypothetical protein [Phorcysia thermohydrogeniphila]|uniref:Uncharacterized protein n=1 Tax=Phorcysia thermohydrogeniphila TaxID=936138 RepID=A0A4R1GEJ4_9BACT|nr:hypothetical protein [Phorcysia thermohydrogeniphila]TCK06644.1 hypothetical protein CLV27_0450 [Phorcysia thermohydrogeniphila]
MGRYKEQSLIEQLALLIEENRFKEALSVAKSINNYEYIHSLSIEEAKQLYSLIGELQKRLSAKKEELSSAIEMRNKVKKAYLW